MLLSHRAWRLYPFRECLHVRGHFPDTLFPASCRRMEEQCPAPPCLDSLVRAAFGSAHTGLSWHARNPGSSFSRFLQPCAHHLCHALCGRLGQCLGKPHRAHPALFHQNAAYSPGPGGHGSFVPQKKGASRKLPATGNYPAPHAGRCCGSLPCLRIRDVPFPSHGTHVHGQGNPARHTVHHTSLPCCNNLRTLSFLAQTSPLVLRFVDSCHSTCAPLCFPGQDGAGSTILRLPDTASSSRGRCRAYAQGQHNRAGCAFGDQVPCSKERANLLAGQHPFCPLCGSSPPAPRPQGRNHPLLRQGLCACLAVAVGTGGPCEKRQPFLHLGEHKHKVDAGAQAHSCPEGARNQPCASVRKQRQTEWTFFCKLQACVP